MGWFWYYILYYLLPIIIFVPMLLRISGIAEHFGVTKTEIEASRTMYPKWWDYVFLGYGWGISYHLDHHLYPTVPSHNIKKLHKILLKNKDFREKAHITPDGTLGVFRECTV
jgi:fatty acid desaturase